MKRKNRVRLYLFFCMIMVPVLSFPFLKGKIDSSNYENRQLAEFPEISLLSLPSFPAKFEVYFNDYLPFKNQLVMLESTKNEFLGVGTSELEYHQPVSVIRGKENWLFYGTSTINETSVNDYLCNNLYEESELTEITDGYLKFQQKLKEYGTEFVVLYVANKEQVYPEYMPSAIVPEGKYSRLDQLVDYIRQNTDIPLIYTKEALKKEKKKHRLFYKYDTHWNHLGGFVGRQLVNEYFHGEYVSLDDISYSVVSKNQSGDLADLLSMRSVYNDDTVFQIHFNETGNKHTLCEDGGDYFVFSSNAADKRSVLVFMDSFGDGLMGIADDFGKVTFTKKESDFIRFFEKETPDIVLLEIVERKKAVQENWCKQMCQLVGG